MSASPLVRAVVDDGCPKLIIVLPLEGRSRIILDALTHEDELRLRRWLRVSKSFLALPQVAAQLLDDLDEVDRVPV